MVHLSLAHPPETLIDRGSGAARFLKPLHRRPYLRAAGRLVHADKSTSTTRAGSHDIARAATTAHEPFVAL